MSALIFYGGSGINIASFCCDACQAEGIEVITEGLCCDLHCHDSESAGLNKTNIDSHHHDTLCSLSRLIYDWDSITSIFKCEPDSFELFYTCLPTDLTLSSYTVDNIIHEYSTGLPVLCPREYLSLLTTLLI